MPRKPKPFLHQGHYYTTRGGVWEKLCPAASGAAEAARILAERAGLRAVGAVKTPDVEPVRPVDRPTGAILEGRFFGGTLESVASRYFAHCRAYYRLPDGRTSSEPASIELAFSFLLRATGELPLNELSRTQLHSARELMKQTCNRKTCNAHTGRIKRGVRWLAEQGLVPDSAAASMLLLSPLPAFRSGVRESPAVPAVGSLDVLTIVERISEPWASIIRLQWFTGLRPGEACGLLVEQVSFDAAGESGEINFGLAHKTGYRGTEKRVQFGQQAAFVLRPWLYSAAILPRGFVFRSTWHRSSESKPPTVSSYGAAVLRACERCGVTPWHPNQLRHSYATRVRAALGLEAAQNALGHASADITQIYAERNAKLAAQAARLLG